MRSSERITRTPREWRSHEDEERSRIAAALLAELRRAREQRAEWYTWIESGRPLLTPAQYELVSTSGAKRRRAERQSRST